MESIRHSIDSDNRYALRVSKRVLYSSIIGNISTSRDAGHAPVHRQLIMHSLGRIPNALDSHVNRRLLPSQTNAKPSVGHHLDISVFATNTSTFAVLCSLRYFPFSTSLTAPTGKPEPPALTLKRNKTVHQLEHERLALAIRHVLIIDFFRDAVKVSFHDLVPIHVFDLFQSRQVDLVRRLAVRRHPVRLHHYFRFGFTPFAERIKKQNEWHAQCWKSKEHTLSPVCTRPRRGRRRRCLWCTHTLWHPSGRAIYPKLCRPTF